MSRSLFVITLKQIIGVLQRCPRRISWHYQWFLRHLPDAVCNPCASEGLHNLMGPICVVLCLSGGKKVRSARLAMSSLIGSGSTTGHGFNRRAFRFGSVMSASSEGLGTGLTFKGKDTFLQVTNFIALHCVWDTLPVMNRKSFFFLIFMVNSKTKPHFVILHAKQSYSAYTE